MPQNIQGLIDQIKTEGVEAAEKQAKDIERDAQKNAQNILADAKAQAQTLIQEAEDHIQKKEEASKKAIQQAARDTLLSLRNSIENILLSVIKSDVTEQLSPENSSKIIEAVVMHVIDQKALSSPLDVVVGQESYDQYKQVMIANVSKQVQQFIHLSTDDDIDRGFQISFDQGKSSFEFSDQAIAEFLGGYLSRDLSTLIKDAAYTHSV